MTTIRQQAGPEQAGSTAGAPTAADVVVRRLRDTDPIPEITALLHRAYAKQVRMGLSPLAGRQDDATTRQRIAVGECYLATLPGASGVERIVGTILFQEPAWGSGPEWFERPGVANFSQFAVEPDLQGLGIGRRLMDVCERRAAETGAEELALSTASPDTELVNFYMKRGYRFIQTFQWGPTNYVSLILSKRIAPADER